MGGSKPHYAIEHAHRVSNSANSSANAAIPAATATITIAARRSGSRPRFVGRVRSRSRRWQRAHRPSGPAAKPCVSQRMNGSPTGQSTGAQGVPGGSRALCRSPISRGASASMPAGGRGSPDGRAGVPSGSRTFSKSRQRRPSGPSVVCRRRQERPTAACLGPCRTRRDQGGRGRRGPGPGQPPAGGAPGDGAVSARSDVRPHGRGGWSSGSVTVAPTASRSTCLGIHDAPQCGHEILCDTRRFVGWRLDPSRAARTCLALAFAACTAAVTLLTVAPDATRAFRSSCASGGAEASRPSFVTP